MEDYIIAPVWVALQLLLAGLLWQNARELYPHESPRQLAMHVVILMWAVVTLGLLGFGAAGLLSRASPFIAAAAVVLILSMFRVVRRGRAGNGHEVYLLALSNAATRPENVAVTLLACFLIGHSLIDGSTGFVTDWDSLMYHIPLVDQWLQAGSLYAPECYQWSNPGGNELVACWVVAPFSGNFFSPLSNIPSTILLMLAVAELTAILGASPGAVKLAAAIAPANYVVLEQLIDVGNDIAVTALFLGAVCYGFRYSNSGRWADLLLFGTSLGLLAGIKYFALGYTAVAWVVCVGLTMRRRGPSTGVRFAVLSLALVACFGGYWYVRNAIASGSPLYPLGMNPSDGDLPVGYPRPWGSSLLGCRRPEVLALGVQALWNMTGPCHFLAALAIPVIVPLLIASRSSGPDPLGRRALALLLFLTLLVYAATPFCVEDKPGTLNQMMRGYTPVRYGLTSLTLSVLGLVIGLDHFGNRRVAIATELFGQAAGRWILFLIGGVGVAFQVMFPGSDLRFDRVAILLIALNALGLAVLGRVSTRFARPVLIVISLLGVGLGTWAISSHWHREFSRAYEQFCGTAVLTTLDRVKGRSKVCLFDFIAYPFFGPERQGRVCQPPVDVLSLAWLLEYLSQHDCDLVIVGTRPGFSPSGGPISARVRGWLEASDAARLRYSDPAYSLYQVKTGRGSVGDDRTPSGPVSQTLSFCRP